LIICCLLRSNILLIPTIYILPQQTETRFIFCKTTGKNIHSFDYC
jgi:hypothetical protein